MSEFHNTYHFIPLHEAKDPDRNVRKDGAPQTGDRSLQRSSLSDFHKDATDSFVADDGRRHAAGHERYEEGCYSGRIVCRLETETPLVVGSAQARTGRNYARVEPFLIEGRPAIPATSLKGAISSLAEAASGSALRVMDRSTPVTFRKPMTEGLSALGMIVRLTTGGFGLRPLAAPIITEAGRHTFFFGLPTGKGDFPKHELWAKVFQNSVPLKTYVGSYGGPRSDPAQFTLRQFARTIDPLNTLDETIVDHPLHSMDVPPPSRDLNSLGQSGRLKYGKGRRNTRLILGYDGNSIDLKPVDQARTNGFIRILGTYNRDMPRQKDHELFLAKPVGEAENRLLQIPPQVVAAFETLAAERVRANTNNREGDKTSGTLVDPRDRKPYLPFRSDDEQEQDWNVNAAGPIEPKLRPGQIVYFDVAENENGRPCVSEISFSSIWRGYSKGARPDDSVARLADFVAALDRELLPMHAGRETITPAERLFGFVEADQKQSSDVAHTALAGRVRIYDARIDPEQDAHGDFLPGSDRWGPQDDEFRGYTPLRILDSPKPPSPALYFRNANRRSDPIAKTELNLQEHRLQGRKVYLHQKAENQPWRTKNPEANQKQKAAVRPVAEGRSFWFHVDFDNLTKTELQLLMFAIQPSAAFRHKLGMGKAIGLGSVRIDPQGIFLIDRHARYTKEDVFAGTRYAAAAFSTGAEEHWPAQYRRERQSAATEAAKAPAEWAGAYRDLIEPLMPDTIHALITLGEFRETDTPVSQPLDDRQPRGSESETFKWFTNNESYFRKDQRRVQQLDPIEAGRPIPVLRTNSKPD